MRRIVEAAHTPRANFEQVGVYQHPVGGEWGMVLRNVHTGLYVMDAGGSLRSVPQSWAREIDCEPYARPRIVYSGPGPLYRREADGSLVLVPESVGPGA